MDHPSVDWKVSKTQDLLEEKETDEILDHHFCFKSCKSPKDYEDCFIWEFNRTREYFGLKYEQKKTPTSELIIDYQEGNSYRVKIKHQDLADVYPFYIDEFPHKPYLSIPFELRSKFSSRKGENLNVNETDLEADYENLLKPMDSINGLKVPIKLYIDPKWGKTKTADLFKSQWIEIAEKLSANKQDLSNARSWINLKYLDSEIDDSAFEVDGSSYIKKLKLLGHFRLMYCVKLDFDRISDVLKESFYTDVSVFLKEIRKVTILNNLLKSIDES